IAHVPVETVEVFAGVTADAPRSHVVDAYAKVVLELLLNAKEPLKRVRGPQIRIYAVRCNRGAKDPVSDTSVRRRRLSQVRAGRKRKRKRKTGADEGARIHKGSGCIGRVQARRIRIKVRIWLVIGDAEATADDGSPFSRRIPSQADARRKIVVIRIPHLRNAAHLGGRNLLKDTAARSQCNICKNTLRFAGCSENFIAQTGIQS